MSQKSPDTSTGDDIKSDQDMHADSNQSQSNTCQPSISSSSEEEKCSTPSSDKTVDTPFRLPGTALSFLHSCGLDSSDIAKLAELPEHLITVENLSNMLLEIRERKLSSTSAASPSTSQPVDDTSSPGLEGSSHTKTVEYPIDRTAPPVHPLPPEQIQTWQDRWGNPRRTSTLTTGASGSRSKHVPDYSVSRYRPYSNPPKASSRSLVDSGPRPLLSLKLAPPVTTPTRKEISDFDCKIPPAYPHVCCLCDIAVRSTKEWFCHVRGSDHAKGQLDLKKKYPKWAPSVESARRNERAEVYTVPTKTEASDFNGVVPPVFPYLCVLCNITVFSEKDWSTHVTGGQHAKSQLDLMEKYPEWDGTVKSSRRNDGHTATDIRAGSSKGKTSDMKVAQVKNELPSQVVSFTPLPAGEGISSELTAIAKRFGSVKKSLFLPSRGYVEMTTLEEAKKLVEHYSVNQLKIKGKLIQVTFSCEYSSLRDAEGNDQELSRRALTQRSSPSRDSNWSDSPRKRCLSENSSPKRRLSSERIHSSPKRKCSSERTNSPESHHVKDYQKSNAEKRSMSNIYDETIDSDGDLEGLEVVVDDGKELVHDLDDCEPKVRDRDDLTSEPMDVADVHTEEQEKAGVGSPNADTSDASNILQEAQECEGHDDEAIKEKDNDGPQSLENCMTVNEFMEENSTDQESNEPKTSVPKTEGLVEMALTSDAERDDERVADTCENMDVVLQSNTCEKYCHVPEERSPLCQSSSLSDTITMKVEESPKEGKPGEEKQVEEKQVEEKQVEEKQVEEKQVEEKQVEEKQVEEKQVEEKQVEEKQVEEKQVEEKQVEEKQVEEKQVEEKQVEEKQVEEQDKLVEEEVNTEPCENVAEVVNEHKEENSINLTECQNVDLKLMKDEGDSDVPSAESSVASSAGVSEKNQVLTEAHTTPLESDKVPEIAIDALNLYDPNIPVGVEFLKRGYYCRVCFHFYSNEDAAKNVHCSSQAHYEKLKVHLEKEKAKAQSNYEK